MSWFRYCKPLLRPVGSRRSGNSTDWWAVTYLRWMPGGFLLYRSIMYSCNMTGITAASANLVVSLLSNTTFMSPNNLFRISLSGTLLRPIRIFSYCFSL